MAFIWDDLNNLFIKEFLKKKKKSLKSCWSGKLVFLNKIKVDEINKTYGYRFYLFWL